ncbi:hypothetical protein MVEN_00193000 [Mycena venus]|uniref:Uncharacterized protein n=1 Tax=Mycena venus TaxID=2733690 RepID=A0A8H6YX33_9AGAR|nr:hypothetical protein MVEN_00193000 [Mycena venus]
MNPQFPVFTFVLSPFFLCFLPSFFFSQAPCFLQHFFFALVSSGVLAQNNDWSVPCLEGQCFYDLPESSGVSGTMRVWGANTAISDVTTAAGWTILDCDPTALNQNIRLVCTGDADNCDHLFQGAGAVNTLVRLPQNCGANAFARVARSWVHEDQSLPDSVARRFARRQDAPLVQGLALDTDFAAADPANGEVNIAVAGTTIPGQTGNLTVTPPPAASRRRSRLQPRGLFSFIEDQFKKFNSFDKSFTESLPRALPLPSYVLFLTDSQQPSTSTSSSLSSRSRSPAPPPAVSASVSVDVEAKAHAVISLGMTAVGTVIPPKMTAFGVFAGLDADLTGTMTFTGSASGSIDSGVVPVFEQGIPGLDFPGLLTIGPTFKIGVQGVANLDIQANAKVTLDYKVDGAKLFFPPGSDSVSSGGSFTPGDSPLSLSVSPDVSSKAVLTGHVIPSIDLGVSALGGIGQATVSLILDAQASATLSLDASATAGVSTDAAASASGQVNGCVDIGAGLDVNAGASADFFGLFNPSTKVSLFSKKFDLFKKCLGTGATRREVVALESSLTRRADLGCPAAIANLVKAVDEPVTASSITAV